MSSFKSTEYFQKTSVISFIRTLLRSKLKYKLNLLTVRSSRIRLWMLKQDRKCKIKKGALMNSVNFTKRKSSNQIRRCNN